MSRPSLINSIINNNHGASMIERGDCTSALSLLAVALQGAKDSMEEEGESSQSGHETAFNLDALISCNALRDSCGDEGYNIFDKPIRIPEPLNENQTSHYPTKVICSAVSIFNLGLAHHLQALVGPTQNSLFLKKAAKLYEFVMQVLQTPDFDGSDPSSTVFWLALLNNLSDVHRRLGDVHISESYCEEVLRVLPYI
jgi:hypothetical protein